MIAPPLSCRAIILLAFLCTSGCATLPRPAKAMLTPLTVVRDVLDVPLVSVTNGFQFFADHTAIAKAPGAGVGWSWKTGPNFGIGYDLSHFLWVGCSWLFGGIDYLICRSLYPNWPDGISPWLPRGGKWGSLYWPNTLALWAEPSVAPKANPISSPLPQSAQ